MLSVLGKAPRWSPRSACALPLLAAALASGACERQPLLAPAPRSVPPEIEQAIRAAGHEGITAVSWDADPETGRETARVLAFLGDDGRVVEAKPPQQARATGLAPLAAQAPATQDWARAELAFPPVAPAGGRATFYARNTLSMTNGFTCTRDGVTTTIMNWRADSLLQRTRFDRTTGAFVPTGGHGAAHRNPKPVGFWAPNAGPADPATGGFRTTYTSERAAGDEWRILYWRITDPNDRCYWAPWDGEGTDGRILWSKMAVRFPGFVRLQAVSNLFIPADWDSDHDDLFYVTRSVRDAAEQAGRNYEQATAALPGGSQVMQVNAASTKFGGINDINNDWNPPHSTHRVGYDLDIDGVNDTPAVHRRLIRAAQRAGFERCERHGPPRRAPNHVHCYWYLYR
jgi:hypothetical protein